MSAGKENDGQNKKNKKKDQCRVLKLVTGKRPLQDSTIIINRPVEAPVRPVEAPVRPVEAPVRLVEVPVHPVEVPVLPVEVPDHAVEVPFQPSGDEYGSIPSSPARSQSFLSDLFDNPVDSETLNSKLNRVLDNQKILFSLFSKLLGEVGQISRAQSLGVGFSAGREQGGKGLGANFSVGREQGGKGLGADFYVGREQGGDIHQSFGVGFSVGGDLSLDRVLDWEVNPVGSQERDFESFDSSRNERDQVQSGVDDSLLSHQFDGKEGADGFFQEALKIKGESCSMGNFAVRLVQKLFTQEELVNRNCKGSRGKEALSESKLNTVKAYSFRLFPTPPGLKDSQWRKCVIAIDEFLRRKKKPVVPERQD